MQNFNSKSSPRSLHTSWPKCVLEHQRGFIRGNHIYECNDITSKIINLSDKKFFGANMTLKIDIRKTFDNLVLQYLIKFLVQYDFYQKFCDWNLIIFHSGKLSIMMGTTHVFFLLQRSAKMRSYASLYLLRCWRDI